MVKVLILLPVAIDFLQLSNVTSFLGYLGVRSEAINTSSFVLRSGFLCLHQAICMHLATLCLSRISGHIGVYW